ncbi:hypothetical protein [Leclercia sp.]|uniref:hypothetical protein n=1 Tax=Leclercia sp. TaxID=1898428 RepID=UPI0028A95876|nr:hypothetical protein [Leclercia sp.]
MDYGPAIAMRKWHYRNKLIGALDSEQDQIFEKDYYGLTWAQYAATWRYLQTQRAVIGVLKERTLKQWDNNED